MQPVVLQKNKKKTEKHKLPCPVDFPVLGNFALHSDCYSAHPTETPSRKTCGTSYNRKRENLIIASIKPCVNSNDTCQLNFSTLLLVLNSYMKTHNED